jgi:hypothetical protein
VPLVVRLAELRVRYEDICAQIDSDGYTAPTPQGGVTKHPLLPSLSVLANNILSLERGLAISFAARGSQTKAAERVIPAQPISAEPTPPDGPRRLRLA